MVNCPCVQGNMRHWTEDPDCRDHFSVIYESGERTAIYANDAKESLTVEERAVSAVYLSAIVRDGNNDMTVVFTSGPRCRTLYVH